VEAGASFAAMGTGEVGTGAGADDVGAVAVWEGVDVTPLEPGSDFGAGAREGSGDSPGAPGPVAGCFSMRRLPLWLRVRTGSASAINCSIFFKRREGDGDGDGAEVSASGVAGGVAAGAASRTGGRRTTPCMAGKVRVPVPTGSAGAGGAGGV